MTPAHKAAAELLYTSRRTRDKVFGADCEGFGEPGWDMLLALAAFGPMVAVNLFHHAAGPNPGTYLNWLVSRELVARTERDTVEIAERGRALLVQYLDHEMRAKP